MIVLDIGTTTGVVGGDTGSVDYGSIFVATKDISFNAVFDCRRGGLAGMQPLGVVHYSPLQLSHWDLRAGAP